MSSFCLTLSYIGFGPKELEELMQRNIDMFTKPYLISLSREEALGYLTRVKEISLPSLTADFAERCGDKRSKKAPVSKLSLIHI